MDPYRLEDSAKPSDQTIDPLGTLTTAAALVFLLAQIGSQSSWVNIVPGLFQLTLLVSALAVVLGIALALLDRQIVAAGASVAILILIFWQINVFAWTANYPANTNVLFTFVPIAGFALFSSTRLNLTLVFKVLFAASIAYCAVYAVFYNVLVSLAGSGIRVLESDAARDVRLYLAVGFAAFAFNYALVRIRGNYGVLWLLATLMAAAAIYMSFSRLFLAAIVVVGAAHLVGQVRRLQTAVLVAFCLVAIALLAGALFPEWNPYSLAAGDDSGAARERAYDIIRNLVSSHFVLGVGIASDAKAEAAFLGEQYVAWDDVGVLGIWYSFGILGVAAFIAFVIACINGARADGQLMTPDSQALSLCGLVFGILSVNSPNIWLGSAVIISVMIVGTRLRAPGGISDNISFPEKFPIRAVRNEE